MENLCDITLTMDPALIGIKSEDVTSQICIGCYSVDRKLSVIGDLTDTFYSLLNPQFSNIDMTQIWVCWECKAELRNVRKIQKKINLVQDFLNAKYSCFQTSPAPPPLTNLAINNTNDTITIQHNETPFGLPKLELRETKIEINVPESKDCLLFDLKSEHDDWEDDFQTEPEKVKPEVSKTKRKKKYTEVMSDCKKQTGGIHYRKVKMTRSELAYWMERDKKDETFLKWRYKCMSCIWGTKYEKGLKRHNKIHHSEQIGVFTCNICSTRFANEAALNIHTTVHNYLRECMFCEYKSSVTDNIVEHIKTRHQACYECNECGLRFHKTRLFHKHYREMHVKFICNECGKICFSRRVIKHHLAAKHSPHECKACNMTFKTRRSKTAHDVLKHVACDKPELAYCVECDKQLDSVLAFRRHLNSSKAHAKQSALIKKNGTFPCTDCDRVYKRRIYMMNHYRHVHLKQSKFYCEDCDRYFLNRTRYVDHRRRQHEGFKPDKNKLCSICGRGFSTNRILDKHMRTHTGERPFPCPHCDAKFTQKESMQSHVKHIHLKVKRQNTNQKFF